MNKGATFCKPLREKAKADGKGLIAVDVDNRHGRWQFWGPIDHDLASKLWTFAHKVYMGDPPREVFASLWPEKGGGE